MATIKIYPIDDTSAYEGYPDTPAGSEIFIRAYSNPGTRDYAYLEFDLTGIKNIETAELTLFLDRGIVNDSTNRLQIRRTNPDWAEWRLTWNNKPEAYADGLYFDWVELTKLEGYFLSLDVTSLAQKDEDDYFSVRLRFEFTRTPYNYGSFNSKENAANKPYLLVQYKEDIPISAVSVTTRLIDSYAPCRTEFHTTWEGGKAPYTLDIDFGTGDTEHVTGIAAPGVYTAYTYLTAGTYNWTATVSDVTSSDSDSGSITIPEEPVEAATIDISSTPTGASIFIDNEDIQLITPFTWFTEPGTYLIALKLDGYEDWETTITIPKPGHYTIDAFLSEVVEEGWITAVKNFLTKTLPGWLTAIPGVIADTLANRLSISDIIGIKIPNVLTIAKSYTDELFTRIYNYLPQWVRDAIDSIKTWWDDITFYIAGKIQDAKDYAYDLVQQIELVIPQWIIDAANSVKTWWDDTVTYVTGAIADVKTWVTTAISTATDWIAKTATDAWNWATTTGTDLYNWFTDTAKDAVNWVNDAGINLFNDFQDFKSKIFDYVEDGIIYILEGLTPTEEEINRRFTEVNPFPK